MTNFGRTTLYIGMTNDLQRRVWEHKNKTAEGFTQRYHLDRLVYFDSFPRAVDAIAIEKKLKGWTRAKKNELISAFNPQWEDLSNTLEEGEILRSAQDDNAVLYDNIRKENFIRDDSPNNSAENSCSAQDDNFIRYTRNLTSPLNNALQAVILSEAKTPPACVSKLSLKDRRSILGERMGRGLNLSKQ